MKSTINLILGSIIGVIILLTFFVFLMLKLNNDVTWSWVWVFSPLLFYFVVYMIELFMLIIKMLVLKGKSKRLISSIKSRRKIDKKMIEEINRIACDNCSKYFKE